MTTVVAPPTPSLDSLNMTASASLTQLPPSNPVAGARFSDTLAAALQDQAAAANNAVATAPASTSDAALRARRALGLDKVVPAAASGGDVILNGISKLRGVFNDKISSLALSTRDITSSEGLFRAQVSTSNFSLFMDVSTKIAGKATQAFESILKGQ